MLLRYYHLTRHPAIFRVLTGLTMAEFVAVAYARLVLQRRLPIPRGHHFTKVPMRRLNRESATPRRFGRDRAAVSPPMKSQGLTMADGLEHGAIERAGVWTRRSCIASVRRGVARGQLAFRQPVLVLEQHRPPGRILLALERQAEIVTIAAPVARALALHRHPELRPARPPGLEDRVQEGLTMEEAGLVQLPEEQGGDGPWPLPRETRSPVASE